MLLDGPTIGWLRRNVTRLLERLRRDERGGMLMVFALSLPVIAASASIAVDYSRSLQAREQMQAIADAAALAAARELSLSSADQPGMASIVVSVVGQFVSTAAEGAAWQRQLETASDLDEDELIVRVALKSRVPVVLGILAGQHEWEIAAVSEAQVLGSPNICVLGLDPSANGTIWLEKDAHTQGIRCAVFSNSAHPNGIKSKKSSSLTASLICSAGGKDGGQANFVPEPLTDCPQFEDPLAERPEPDSSGACDATGLVVSGETKDLEPGIYCGGLHITDAARVTLTGGVYIMKDGPLTIDGGAEVRGRGVGVYLTGAGSVLQIEADSTVALEAGRNGAMAGLLVFESRTQPATAKHTLLADDAQIMVGTIYLPRGELRIGGSSEVGTNSAYTAIVARQLTLTEGPTVVLHTDYDKTDVPVPEGIKGTNQPVALIR